MSAGSCVAFVTLAGCAGGCEYYLYAGSGQDLLVRQCQEPWGEPGERMVRRTAPHCKGLYGVVLDSLSKALTERVLFRVCHNISSFSLAFLSKCCTLSACVGSCFSQSFWILSERVTCEVSHHVTESM